MSPADADRRPFGARREPPQVADPDVAPTPVLHVGEVHAELRLHITRDTLDQLGAQIAGLIADATAQGFQAGMEVGMARVEDATGPPAEFTAGAAYTPDPGWSTPVRDDLTADDLRRAAGE